MKAVLVKSPGGTDRLTLGETDRPQPSDNELLIKMKATSLNRADLLQRQGHYPPPPDASPVLGLDLAGVVERAGKNCPEWKEGDAVFGLIAGGGYAEYAVIHHKMAMRKPQNLTFEEAAAIPEAFLTAYQALSFLGDLQPDQYVLIHAGASGVGSAAIQLAREMGAKPIITAGSEEKLAACRKLGAIGAINYHKGTFAEEVMDETQGRGVDLVIDFIGANYWEQNLSVLAMDGKLVFLSMMSGSQIDRFDLRIFMKKRLKIMGSTLRNRPLDYKIALTAAFSQYAMPRFEEGQLRPVIDRVFSWEAVAEAHQYMEENRNTGKIVLEISD